MTGKKHLLVVEDSQDFLELLRELFETEGYEVVLAKNGLEALQRLNESVESVDLILLDLMMPVMDGFEFREHQRENPDFVSIPVVLMTAHGDLANCQARLGAREAIRKPADLENLLAVVKRQIGRPIATA